MMKTKFSQFYSTYSKVYHSVKEENNDNKVIHNFKIIIKKKNSNARERCLDMILQDLALKLCKNHKIS